MQMLFNGLLSICTFILIESVTSLTNVTVRHFIFLYLYLLTARGVFHEETLKKTYLNFILMAKINYNLDAIYWVASRL